MPSQNSVKQDLPRMRLALYHFSKNSRSEPYEKHLSYCQQKLWQNTLNWQTTREDFAAFYARVTTTLELMPTDVVDRTTLSVDESIKEIIKQKGQRIKFWFCFDMLLNVFRCIGFYFYTECLASLYKHTLPASEIFNIM